VRAYRYGGIDFRTTLEWPGFSPLSGGAAEPTAGAGAVELREDLTLAVGARRLEYAWGGRFGLALHAVERGGWLFTLASGAEFYATADGEKIACRLGPAGWSEFTAEGFVRRVLPRLVQLRGRALFHAATLATPAGAIMICGFSGAGKSTLAASLHQRLGWPILGDDMAVVEATAVPGLVHATGGSVSLWEETRTGLAVPFARETRLAAYGSKFRCELAGAPVAEGAPLGAIYVLQRSEPDLDPAIAANAMEPAARVGQLDEFAIRFNPADPRGGVKRFRALVQLANTVPCRRLHYPRRFEFLPAVAALLATDVAQCFALRTP
jgi:hypothetical protein